MRRKAEAWKHGDVDFGQREKPEQALPKHGDGVGDDARGLSDNEIQRGKKVRTHQAIGEQANTGRQENAEN